MGRRKPPSGPTLFDHLDQTKSDFFAPPSATFNESGEKPKALKPTKTIEKPIPPPSSMTDQSKVLWTVIPLYLVLSNVFLTTGNSLSDDNEINSPYYFYAYMLLAFMLFLAAVEALRMCLDLVEASNPSWRDLYWDLSGSTQL